jgi:hypothetical protein
MDEVTSGPGPSVINVPPGSRWGFFSAGIFLVAGALELFFFVGAMLAVTSHPSESGDTLPLSATIGMLLLGGQAIHIAGVVLGILGLRYDRDRTLAWIGVATNSIIPLVCLLSLIVE